MEVHLNSLLATINCNHLLTCNLICDLGHKNNGVRPSHFCGSSGSVARKVLQALEAIKLVEKDAAGGRRLTSQGFRDLDRIASQIKSAKA